VIFAGPGTNLLVAVALFTILFMIGGGPATATVDEVLPGHPAAQAGLHPGDRIVAIDGSKAAPDQIRDRIAGTQGKPIVLVVERGGRVTTIGPVRPKKEAGAYRLGFVLRGAGLGFPAAAWESVRLTGRLTDRIVTSLGSLVHRQGRKQISSPVGIVQGSSNALHQGLQTFLWVIALISLSLALLNLLPLLPLDGGHIAFSLVEGVRGRAVGREVYERVSVVGIAIVLMLFFIGLSNDVGRLGGG
jgi:regulator of sigma E protease